MPCGVGSGQVTMQAELRPLSDDAACAHNPTGSLGGGQSAAGL